MLSINSIKKGIVIDHIKAGCGIKIFELLELKDVDYTVALIMNVDSKKFGKKDLIKIENTIDIDLNILSLLDKNITINIIEDEKIKEKKRLIVPKTITSIITCNNPRCITTSERHIGHKLTLVDKDEMSYKCDYCEHIYRLEK